MFFIEKMPDLIFHGVLRPGVHVNEGGDAVKPTNPFQQPHLTN